jgi:drug/metabolite transporter (DMT)-like permease
MAKPAKALAYLALVAQTLISAGTYILGKYAVAELEPLSLCFMRFGGAALILLLICGLKGVDLRVKKEELPQLIGLGVLVVAADPLLFLYGLRLSTPAQISLLYPLTPVFVLIIAGLRGLERPDWLRWLGVVLSLAGVSLFLAERGLSYQTEHLFGDLLVLGAVVSWSLYTTFSKPLVERRGTLAALTLAVCAGMILFTPVGLTATITADFSTVSGLAWLGLVYLIVMTVVVGYFCWNYALGRLEASRVAVMANGQPVATTILAAIFTGEQITLWFVIGGVITLTGVTIAQLRGRKRGAVAQPGA